MELEWVATWAANHELETSSDGDQQKSDQPSSSAVVQLLLSVFLKSRHRVYGVFLPRQQRVPGEANWVPASCPKKDRSSCGGDDEGGGRWVWRRIKRRWESRNYVGGGGGKRRDLHSFDTKYY
ncbi:unnamed protein product [Linum trigynum]|uniref:Uncharacterized protein n=1 Tax=Linum trigynum TaxID=586398 RepID=A0AAV2DGP7_9ROSI